MPSSATSVTSSAIVYARDGYALLDAFTDRRFPSWLA